MRIHCDPRYQFLCKILATAFGINSSLFNCRWIFLGQGRNIVALFAFHINHVISRSKRSFRRGGPRNWSYNSSSDMGCGKDLAEGKNSLATPSTRQWREQSSSSSSCIFTTIPCTNLCCLGQRNSFNHTFDGSHYSNGMLCGANAFFCSLASLKIILLVAPGILSMILELIHITHWKISLNHRNQVDVSSFKNFSENPCTFIYFCHHTAVYSFNDSFICFEIAYFFYINKCVAFYKVFNFHIPYRLTN